MKANSKTTKAPLRELILLMMIAALPCSATETACVPPPTGLVSWWPGDGNYNDIVGHNDGTLENGAGFGVGKVLQGFTFDGVDDYVSIPGSFGGGAEVTIDAWVRTSAAVSDFQAIVSSRTSEEWVHVQMNDAGGNIVAYTDGGIVFLPIIPETPTGVWRHIAVVIASGASTLYEDGIVVGTDATTFTTINTTTDIRIGSGHADGRFFHGDIDEVELFDRALSASEIHAIFAAGSSGNCKAKEGDCGASGSCTPPSAGDRIEAPKADDHRFVYQTSGADAACVPRSHGPILLYVPVTRYVGEVDGDGHLLEPTKLVANHIVSATAKLQLAVWDVDFDTPAVSHQPELTVVKFNGEFLEFVKLYGSDGNWTLDSFDVPIEKVKFPPRGEPGPTGAYGVSPLPAVNIVEIDVDIANTSDVWCNAVDWAQLEIKAMSPVIMVHGNNSDGGFWARKHPETSFKGFFDEHGVPSDNSITMVTDSVVAHGAELESKLPAIVRSFGVDSVHLVAHSKGGLDSREWLAESAGAEPFKVLSLITLDTPHKGSALADLKMRAQEVAYVEGSLPVALLKRLSPFDLGVPDLTTWANVFFNANNAPRLPPDVEYRSLAADCDLNGNGEVDVLFPDEFAGDRVESEELRTAHDSDPILGPPLSRLMINQAYGFLRSYGSVNAVTEVVTLQNGHKLYSLGHVGVPNPGGDLNDTLVTINSARGPAPFIPLRVLTGADGRDHASIADAGTAVLVFVQQRVVEAKKGDFR